MDSDNQHDIEPDWQEDESPRDVQGLWFFLPLPHPLGLPPKWRSLRQKSTAELWNADRSHSAVTFRSSLLIHQVPPHVDVLATRVSELMVYAIATMADQDPTDAPPQIMPTDDASPLRPGRTVAEVMVPGILGETEEELNEALDIALDHVRWVQRAVAAATQDPVRLISRTTLPPTVPTFRATAHEQLSGEDVRKPTVDTSIMWFIPRSAPPVALGVEPALFDDKTLSKIHTVMERAIDDNPFLLYTDIRREAFVQRQFDGNHRMTLVALATAGEVLCDTVLMSMLWEEHVAPVTAADYFDRSHGHTLRIAKYIPPRIGGSWDPSASSPAGAYLRDLVRLRHRVVHAGHQPTTEEVDTAWSALFGLEHYIGDRLVAGKNLRRYARTAVAWMAETGLRQRNRFPKHVEQLMSDTREPNWDETFARWRRHVDRALDPSPKPPGEDPAQIVGFAEVTRDSTIRWTMHDGSTSYAAVVEATDIATPEQIASLHQAVAAIDPADPKALVRFLVPLAGSPPPAAQWRPDHEIYDEVEIYPRTATPGPPTGP